MDINYQNLQSNIGELEEDRFSKLPDSLLHHILSFLDIKHVARTCVLSKRWKYIWTSIPTLDLQFWELYAPPSVSEMNKFMDFVDRTLHQHDASNIQKFALNLYENMNASRVHSWIENVTRHNVEELSLCSDLYQYLPLSVPLSLFTCESLTKLELRATLSMNFPKNIFFPKLKSLTLSTIEFGDTCWSEEPFSNCLVLEELILDNCTWFRMKKFCILTPLLKVLEITNDFDDEEERLGDCDLKIHAPSLVSLTYCGCVAKDYDLSSFLTLVTADVEFLFLDQESRRLEKRKNQEISKFLQALSHVRCLSLRVHTKKVLSVGDGFMSNLPTFHNLNELKLHNGVTMDKRVSALLKAAPYLKRLVFYEFEGLSCADEKEYDETEDLFRHLRSVRFMAFCREARELRWAKLILKNAKSLRRMTIAFNPHFSNEENKELVISELQSFQSLCEMCG